MKRKYITPTHPSRKNLQVAKILEDRILPAVRRAQRKEFNSWPYEGSNANEEILLAAIAFLRGENPHLSGFISISTWRWQGQEFVRWLKQLFQSYVGGLQPDITAKEALEWLTPFRVALLHHKDLPQDVN